jgi:predicted RNA-binding Zn ribbon-like protein
MGGFLRVDWHAIELTRTVGWKMRDRSDDDLSDYEGLVAWSVRRAIVSSEEADALLRQARRRPAQAAAALEDARSLRSLIYHLFSTVGRGDPSDPDRLDDLTAWVHRFLPARRLRPGESGATWGWRLDPYRLDHLLGPVTHSAAELLTSQEVKRLRLCEGDGCGWLFVDASRNRSRRWCDMSDCGNRAKVRSFRARRREDEGAK